MQSFSFIPPPYGFWGEDFFFRKFTPYVAIATNQIQQIQFLSFVLWLQQFVDHGNPTIATLSFNCVFSALHIEAVVKKSEMRSFKSNENIHKKEGGSYYVVSANKASSVTL